METAPAGTFLADDASAACAAVGSAVLQSEVAVSSVAELLEVSAPPTPAGQEADADDVTWMQHLPPNVRLFANQDHAALIAGNKVHGQRQDSCRLSREPDFYFPPTPGAVPRTSPCGRPDAPRPRRACHPLDR